MKRTKVIALTLAVVSASSVYFLYEKSAHPSSLDHVATADEAYKETNQKEPEIHRVITDKTGNNGALIAELKQRFGRNIEHPKVQLEMLRDLNKFLRNEIARTKSNASITPSDIDAYIRDSVTLAFAEQAEAILQLFENYGLLNTWMQDNQDYLASLSLDQRREAIWDARRQFLGDLVEEIWAPQLARETVDQALASISESDHEKSMDIRLQEYRSAIESAYGSQATNILGANKAKFVGDFLRVKTVQSELGSLSPIERERALANIRKTLNMPQAQIERMRVVDRNKEDEWQQGQSYMLRRDALLQEFSSDTDAHQAHLMALQREYFGEQAIAIAAEEAAGYFRFERSRIYGIN